jgi:phosphate transport system permease protein
MKIPIADSLNWGMKVYAYLCALIFFGVCLLFLGEVTLHGLNGFEWHFITDLPKRSGREGGIFSILVSTSLILFVCLSVVVPIGVMTAIKLSDFSSVESKTARAVRGSLNVLSGVPSIVFGLFGNAIFSKYLGMGFSILSGGLTLACMVLPMFIKLTEESLLSVNKSYSQNALSLGISKSALLWNVTIPYASPGILIALLVSTGRALSETAALIFTSGYVDRIPESLMDSGRSLSVHIFDLAMNVGGGDANAYRSALVLMVSLFLINSVSKIIVKKLFKKRVYR